MAKNKISKEEQELLDGLFKQLYGTTKMFILMNAPEIGKMRARIMVEVATAKLAELYEQQPLID